MAAMNVYSDSIGKGDLVGYGLANPSIYKWPNIVADKLGLALANHSVNGAMVYDQAAAVYSQIVGATDLSFLALGANDASKWGISGNRIADSCNAFSAMAAWLAIPDASKTRVKTGATFTGTWSDTVAYGLGKVSRENGATLSFTAPGPITYIAFNRQNTAFGTCSIRENGVEVATFATGLNSSPDTYLGISYGPSLVRLTGVAPGATIEIVVTSPSGGNNWLYVDWFAAPVSGPRVMFGTPTRKWCEGYTQSGGSEIATLRYRNALKAAAQQLIDDGLNITIVDMYRIINPAADLFQRRPDNSAIDWVHWNEAGNCIGAESYLEAI